MLNAIACIDLVSGIGKDGSLLFSIPDDMKRFRKLTEGGIVIMGRKTFDSLPKGELPNRENLVLTSREMKSEKSNVKFLHTVDQILGYCKGKDNVFCIGGGEIYKEFFPYTDHIYLTLVYTVRDADSFFPDIKGTEWSVNFLKTDSFARYDDRSGLKYKFLEYDRL